MPHYDVTVEIAYKNIEADGPKHARELAEVSTNTLWGVVDAIGSSCEVSSSCEEVEDSGVVSLLQERAVAKHGKPTESE